MSDPFRLERFVEAQQSCYEQVRRELEAGRKQTHWMWFIFPQIGGLGVSPTAQHFAIASLAEASAYLAHPVLGGRLRECTRLVNESGARSAAAIFGELDAMKFRSSMTLFAHAVQHNATFEAALGKFFDGKEDPLTLMQLSST
jgi:uncharacterized protein (DUF1810 family)